MAKDYFARAPRVDVHAPPRKEILLVERTDVYHQQEFHHHQLDPIHIEEGPPSEPVNIGVRSAEVRIHESDEVERHVVRAKKPSIWSALVNPAAARQQAAIAAPDRAQYRGEMRSAPAPQREQLALPAQQAPQQFAALPAPPQRAAAPEAAPRHLALPSPQTRPAPPQNVPQLTYEDDEEPRAPSIWSALFSPQKVRR